MILNKLMQSQLQFYNKISKYMRQKKQKQSRPYKDLGFHSGNYRDYNNYTSTFQTYYKPAQTKSFNRKQICPFLVRVFYAVNDQNQFTTPDKFPVARQLRFHLWINSTLRQISQLMRAHVPSIRTKQKFTFWKVSYNKQKKQYVKTDLGFVFVSRKFEKGQNQKTLLQTKFNVGDIIDVAVTYK